MKISIVTISYNQAKYLRQCIDSVLDQKGVDLEYIIVDPGSTDGSREIIYSYGDRVIRVFEPDDGPADGLNRGFSRATGDFYYFLNSDDYLEPGALKNIVESYKLKKDVDVFIACGYIEVDGLKKLAEPDVLDLDGLLLRTCRIFQQGTFFSREIYLSAGGFNKYNRTCWDYELFLNFARLGAKCALVNKKIATFRIHNSSISGTGKLNAQYRKELDKLYFDFTGAPWGYKGKFKSAQKRVFRFAISLFRRMQQKL